MFGKIGIRRGRGDISQLSVGLRGILKLSCECKTSHFLLHFCLKGRLKTFLGTFLSFSCII